jgi:hypothetical protein
VSSCSHVDFRRTCQARMLGIRGVGSALPGTVAHMTIGETEALYERALQVLARLPKKSVNEVNNNSRKQTFAEFQEFLARNAVGVTVETATAADIGAFVEEWIPNHSAGCWTKLPATGQPVPSVLADAVVKHLSN